MEIFKVGPFEVKVDRFTYTVCRTGNSISMMPAEGATATSIILRAATLRNMKTLPDKISHSPFEVQFTPERLLYFTRKDRVKEKVAFQFTEGDTLVEAIKAGADKLKDITTIQGAPGGGISHYQVPDPILEGR